MKQSALSILLMLSLNIMAETPYFYMNEEPQKTKLKISALYFGIGYYLVPARDLGTPGYSGTLLLSNDWGLSFNSRTTELRAKNMPPDYNPGTFLFFRLSSPNDYLAMNSICLAREFRTKTRMIRYGFEAGPSFVRYTETHFTRDTNPNNILGEASNYNYYHTEKKTTGVLLKAKFELPLSRVAGLEFVVSGNINSRHSIVRSEICLTLGLVRERRFPTRPR